MITSTQNPRIIEARKLTERKHRRQQNRFLAEGLQLLSLAVEMMATPAGRTKIKPLELFYSETLFTGKTAPHLLAQLTQAGAEAIPVAPNVLDTLSERDVSQGLAVTFSLSDLEGKMRGGGEEARRRGGEGEERQGDKATRRQGDVFLPYKSSPHESSSHESSSHESSPHGSSPHGSSPHGSSPHLLLVLDKLQDPGNLGTLIRTADAVGVQRVILLEPCVDPFDPKTVRGTMGSLFTMPFARTKNTAETLADLAQKGYRLVGADGQQGEPPWRSEILAGPVALVLGNEARGLSPEVRPYLHDYVRLPLRGRAESLNVAVAGGTLMYEWLRMNSEL